MTLRAIAHDLAAAFAAAVFALGAPLGLAVLFG